MVQSSSPTYLKLGYRIQKNVRVFLEVLNACSKKVNDMDCYALLFNGGDLVRGCQEHCHRKQ